MALNHSMYPERKTNTNIIPIDIFKTCTDENNYFASGTGSYTGCIWYLSDTSIGTKMVGSNMGGIVYGIK